VFHDELVADINRIREIARVPHLKSRIESAGGRKVHSARKPAARFRGEEYNPQPSQAVHAGTRLRLRSKTTAGLVRRSTPLNQLEIID
jgi:hypothetical protein